VVPGAFRACNNCPSDTANSHPSLSSYLVSLISMPALHAGIYLGDGLLRRSNVPRLDQYYTHPCYDSLVWAGSWLFSLRKVLFTFVPALSPYFCGQVSPHRAYQAPCHSYAETVSR